MSGLDYDLTLFQDAVHYMDVSGNLERVKERAARYSNQQNKKLVPYELHPSVKLRVQHSKSILGNQNVLIYRFQIVVDPAHLTELSAPLGNNLLWEPKSATLLFQNVVFVMVTEMQLLPQETSQTQISVNIKLTALPKLKGMRIETLNELSSCTRGYISCTGVVIGMTDISKYTQSTRYVCPNSTCKGSLGNHFIRIHSPGALEFETIRKDFKCAFCECILQEVKSCRQLSDKVVAEMVPDFCFRTYKYARFRQQCIPLFVRDEMITSVKIGHKYTVIGLVRKDNFCDRIIHAIEVNNLTEESQLENFKLPVSNRIVSLFKDECCSNFPQSLAFFHGGIVSPPGTFFSLKLACLLSLACKIEEQVRPIHILAIGRETEILSNILIYCMKFSDRYLLYSTGNHVTSKASSDKYRNSNYFIEGGSFMLAKNGVLNIGNISRFKKPVIEKIQSVLSSGKVVTDVDSKFTQGQSLSLEQPLQCRVWAYMEGLDQKKNEDLFSGTDSGTSVKNILDAFDLVIFTDNADSTTMDEVVHHTSHQTLKNAVEQDFVEDLLNEDDLLQYIKYINCMNISTSEEANRLVHGYYLATRKARNTPSSTSVSVTVLSTLISLAISHARLCMRNVVTETDALGAIHLYEESLTARYGYSMLSVLPSTHIPGSQIEKFLSDQNNQYKEQFRAKLMQFCGVQRMSEE